MSDLDHLTIHHGSVVEPRHLTLVSSDRWPDENDEDRHYDQPVRQSLDVWSVITLLSAGAFIATCVWFQIGGA